MKIESDLKIPSPTIDLYVSRRKEDFIRCQKALNVLDFHSIECVGHRLKGNGVTFGFPEISKLGEALETAARRGSEEDLSATLKSFSNWLSQKLKEQY